MSDRTDDLGDDVVDDDLVALRAIGARLPRADVAWETPPDGLWDRIAAATASAGPAPMETPSPVPPSIVAHETAGSPEPPETPVTPVTPDRTVVPFRPSSRSVRRWLVPAVSIAAALVAALAFGAIANRSGEPDVLAATELDLLGEAGSGQAELVDDGGTLQIRLDTADLDAGDGFLEVWLIDPTVSKLVSLGPLRPDGVYDLPPGVDPAAFPIVDISIEPVDGDPTHSGNSVLRGQLPV